MLIIIDKPGQLCNRLWAFSPFIEDALEKNHKIIILHFYDYYDYFENLNIYKNVKFIKLEKSLSYYNFLFRVLNKIPKKVLKALNIFYNSNICISELNLKNNIVFIKGWTQQKPKINITKFKTKQLFLPKKNSSNKVNNFFISKRKKYDKIIGIHIRRGDYKEFRNGVYFYSDLTYIDFISQLSKEFNTETKLGFLLCSNEKINTEAYKDFSVFQINEANIIEDLYGLSKCDYIFGPPSTYSMWASFYGQKPLLLIKNKTTKLKIKDFSKIIAQNKFENGKLFYH